MLVVWCLFGMGCAWLYMGKFIFGILKDTGVPASRAGGAPVRGRPPATPPPRRCRAWRPSLLLRRCPGASLRE